MWNWMRQLVGAPAPAPAPAPVPAAAPAPPLSTQAPGPGRRQPLVERGGALAGFYLQLPESLLLRLGQQAQSPAAVAHHRALLAAAAPWAAADKVALVCVPSWVLAREGVADAVPPHTWLCLDSIDSVAAPVQALLRRRGVLLGVPDSPPRSQPRVDFVLLQAQASGLDTLILSAQRWSERLPGVKVVAQGLAHIEDVELALKGGAHLACGAFARSATTAARRELGSTALRVCELLNHLALDRDTAVIADAVRGDVALAYRLLRYANSPAIGPAQPVQTVDQAVLLLGRGELYRWLSVQLLSAADSRQASRALQETALARGRLLETVAQQRGESAVGAFFTLGMLSLIEPLLQVPLALALAPLRLSEAVRAALLQREGPLAGYLRLLDAMDTGVGTDIDACAAALGIADTLGALNEQAWAWAGGVV